MPEALPVTNPVLHGVGIDKNFGAFRVLKAVDFRVNTGEAVGIVGPNGAGKTTLFGVLAGAFPPTAGSVAFEEHDITDWTAARRSRHGLARTHQIPRPFLGMTVFENVLTGANNGGGLTGREAGDCAAEALERTQLLDHANRPAAALGLLDRKRLELARALATRPRVILLDEIGGGLTEAELHRLVNLIAGLKAGGLTIVWIEHILHALLKIIDRLVCMSAGEVIAQGEPRQVMADADVRRAYLGSGVE
ncbi:ABC transporter ATP-binding protein [Pelagibacterium halotolerans]|uniref:ABC transporter ATP-binding protein n=1 Tax=Pelagibacterium halotolerans TaxID=531813 RepID=UPI0038513B9A